MFSARVTLGFTLAALLVGSAAPLYADPILGPAGSGWQTWNRSWANQTGFPYWDGNSSDSTSPCNIGNFVAGQFGGDCTLAGFYANSPRSAEGADTTPLSYWGNSTGGSSDFYFTADPGTTEVSTLLLEIAGLSTRNQFGWYDLGTGTLNPIFVGSEAPLLSKSVSITSSSYGFYLGVQSASNPGVFDRVYFSQTSRNTSDVGGQHFAIFRSDNGSTYYIGMEDLDLWSSDRDYNDMVISVKSGITSVPEPATASLLLVGLAVGARHAARTKRRRQ